MNVNALNNGYPGGLPTEPSALPTKATNFLRKMSIVGLSAPQQHHNPHDDLHLDSSQGGHPGLDHREEVLHAPHGLPTQENSSSITGGVQRSMPCVLS